MRQESSSPYQAAYALTRSQFGVADIVRRRQGDALEAFGFGPQECGHEVTASGLRWRLREYASRPTAPTLMIVAAPIKRPYIWDLTPPVSVIRRCLQEGLSVSLLEWLPAAGERESSGLDEYVGALEINLRVERWSLDEMPLPGKLVRQILEWLYRDDRLCRETLEVLGTRVEPSTVSTPMLVVVNTADDVAPLASVKPFVEAKSSTDVRLIHYEGETGVGLQRLGILIGRKAHTEVWPEIIGWIKRRAAAETKTRT
jgi:poly(3-hydroxyalkanoate) synthetase